MTLTEMSAEQVARMSEAKSGITSGNASSRMSLRSCGLLASSCLAGLLGYPGIKQRNANRLEVCNIAADDCQTENHRRRGDQGIAFLARIGNMKARQQFRCAVEYGTALPRDTRWRSARGSETRLSNCL